MTSMRSLIHNNILQDDTDELLNRILQYSLNYDGTNNQRTQGNVSNNSQNLLNYINKFVVVDKNQDAYTDEDGCCICYSNGSDVEHLLFLPCCSYKKTICKSCLTRHFSIEREPGLSNDPKKCPTCRSDMIDAIDKFHRLSKSEQDNLLPPINSKSPKKQNKNIVNNKNLENFINMLNNIGHKYKLLDDKKKIKIYFGNNGNIKIDILYSIVTLVPNEIILLLENIKYHHLRNEFIDYNSLIKLLSQLTNDFHSNIKNGKEKVAKENCFKLVNMLSSNCFNMLKR